MKPRDKGDGGSCPPKVPAEKFGRFQLLTCTASLLYMVSFTLITLSGMILNVRQYNCTAQLLQQQLRQSSNLSSSSVDDDLSEVPWSQHQGFRSSLSLQYRLCDRGIGDFTNVAFFVGATAGSLAAGPSSDTFGRKPCILIGQLMAGLVTLASNYAPSLWLHLASRCLAGCFLILAQCAVQVYGCEVHSHEHRGRFLAAWSTGVSVGTLAVGLLAHLTRHHQLYVLISCSVSVVPLLINLCLPESPAWLAARGHLERAEAAQRRIDWINGRRPRRPQRPLLDAALLTSTAPAPATVEDVARRRRGGWRAWNCDLLRLLSTLGLHGLCQGLNCYGFYFVMSKVIPDVCLYAILLGASQLPYAFLLSLIPRRPGLIACSLLSGLLCLAFGAVAGLLPGQQRHVLAALGVAGCFCSTAAFNLLVTLSAESFPTGIRNTSLGLCTFCLRCGSALSPLVNFLPSAPLQSVVLACPLLLSNLVLGLTLSGVVGPPVRTWEAVDDELTEKKLNDVELDAKQ